MYELTAIQIEEDARDARDAADIELCREDYYFWQRCEAQDAEYAAYLANQADIDEVWWEALSRKDR